MKGLLISANDDALFTRDSVRVETEIFIHRSRREVFNLVTTPAQWHTWRTPHQATGSVSDVPNRPLAKGETVREVIAVADRFSEAVWTVITCDAPQRWEIATDTPAGTAHITYRLTPTNSGCRCHRTLDFRSKHGLQRLLDSSLTRWILTRQSARALANLKGVMERLDSQLFTK